MTFLVKKILYVGIMSKGIYKKVILRTLVIHNVSYLFYITFLSKFTLRGFNHNLSAPVDWHLKVELG